MPNGPKVTTGGSLSPRGDWRAPSDGNARLWVDELLRNVPAEEDEAGTLSPDTPRPGTKPLVR